MTSTKTVIFEEAETVMNRTKQVPIFRIPEERIPLLYKDLEAKNTVLNLELSMFEDKIPNLDKRRLLMKREPEMMFQSIFNKDSEEYKRRIRQSSKLCKSYTCSKQFIRNSDDENFWRAAMNNFSSVETAKETWVAKKEKKDKNIMEKDTNSDDAFMEDMNEGNIFYGNIKVTIKDKPVVKSKEQILEILRISFEALKKNAEEGQRLRELKTKVQENMAKRKLRRYFDAWRNRVSSLKTLEKKKKEDREMSNERKIEVFINAIVEKRKELTRLRKSTSFSPIATKSGPSQRCQSAPEKIIKGSLLSRNSPGKASLQGRCKANSQSRLQVQSKIIKEQRFKLVEQNRIIEEMRLKGIERDARKANKDTIDAAKSVLAHCGRRTRRSLLYLMREQVCRDESSKLLQLPKTPDFLVRMEARAEVRRERVRQAEEARSKKSENEKRRKEEARKKEEMDRKRLQREAQREVKRLREEREEKRIRDAEKIKLLNKKAEQFYYRFLLRRYIFEPLLALIIQKRKHTEKAANHYNETLLRKVFVVWKSETDEQNEIKKELAISIYERNLLWSSISDWKQYTSKERQKYQAASDFHDMKVQMKILKILWIRTLEMKTLKEKNKQIAKDHYDRNLKMKFFYMWRRFPEISEEVKQSEKQKREWRELVQRIIPDFNPRHRGVATDD